MQTESQGNQSHIGKYLLAAAAAAFVLFLSWMLFTAFRPWPPLTVPDEADLTATSDLASALEQQMQKWLDDLFLETYAVTYKLPGTDAGTPTLISQAHFRFAGWREDWVGKWLSRFNANHVIVRVAVDTRQRRVVDFSYSHGEAFGFDAPLNIKDWPVNEHELLRICGLHGGKNFEDTYQTESVHVDATVNRPGRVWTVVYDASPQYFECVINIDSGSVLVKNAESDWKEVGNLNEINLPQRLIQNE
jgi:hypothetical protein